MTRDFALLVSIKPEFADKVFSGTKSVELRRIRPRISKGQFILIYVTAPRMAIEGYAVVENVHSDSPSALWNKVKDRAGVSRSKFRSYFEECETAYGIELIRGKKLQKPIPLPTLREQFNGFHPPQSYQYLSEKETISLVGKI